MDIQNYRLQNTVESTHWWYLCRRRMLRRYIEKFSWGKDSLILDGGTSTGTNLRLLQEMGFERGIGLDFSSEATNLCQGKNLGIVVQGDLTLIPFDDDVFDGVLATDVFEHIDDDEAAINECFRVLKVGGHAIFTVPAFPSIWGLQDDVSHHKRRYLGNEILDKVKSAGFEIEDSYYFNFLLFLPIWIARKTMYLFRIKVDSEAKINTYWMNEFLGLVFKIDILFAPFVKPPFGVSFFIKAKKSSCSSD